MRLKPAVYTAVLAPFLLSAAIVLGACTPAVGQQGGMRLEPGIPIVVPPDAPGPVLRAAEDLQRDLEAILQAESPIVRDDAVLAERGCVVIASPGTGVAKPEAHRVFVEERAGNLHLVAQGSGTRGSIYAIYTISEEILGVPPLWIWASWTPEQRSSVPVPLATDLTHDAPAVRWRAWFPNDMDYYQPWTRLPASETEPLDTRDAIYETMLRLKLNAVDVGGILNVSGTGISSEARRAADRGLVVLSTHTAALGTRLEERRWENYWSGIRGRPAPPISLDHEEELFEYWRHSMDTILESGIETLWTVTLRGHGDVAFWERMEDVPETDEERAAAIERVVRRQFDLLNERTGGDAVARVTMYNEISDYFLDGLLTWPESPNLVWNFTAARRDHYPPAGLTGIELPPSQPLGYYMNLQFTSTGSHVAQGEGPWKMEANFRTALALNEEPLAFSIVNAGNIREFVMELSANAAMMWDPGTYDSDVFLHEFSGTYFGEGQSDEIAGLYRDFYDAYWEQRAPDISGFDRQYIFHDFRYGRAMRDIIRRLERGETTDQPLGGGFADLSFYMIDPEHSGAGSVREAMEFGTGASIERWESVVTAAEDLLAEVDAQGRRFFEDNVLVQARFMLAINRGLHALTVAVSPHESADERYESLVQARGDFQEARNALAQAEHGYFSDWYPGEGQRDLFRFHEIQSALDELVDAGVPSEAVAIADFQPGAEVDGDWIKIDDFEEGPLVEEWSLEGDPAAFSVVPDPDDTDNLVLFQRGDELEANSSAWRRLPEPLKRQGTLFYRQLITSNSPTPGNRQSWQLGVNSAGTGGGANWWEYAVRTTIDFSQHRAGDDRTHAESMLPYAWHNFWLVVDQDTETMELYRTQGTDTPGPDERVTAGRFREAAEDLSVLKLSRGHGGRDWQTHLDDFYMAQGVNLTIPQAVENKVPRYEVDEWIEVAGTWEYGGHSHAFTVKAAGTLVEQDASPTVLYLLNLPIPRIGTDPDEAIVSGLLDEGMIVVEVDASTLPETSPDIERALLHFYQGLDASIPAMTGGRLQRHERFTYWLPSGYRLERDLPFWNIAQHGTHGSLEWIMDTHNNHVVANHGVETVDSPQQLRGRDGNPLDYNLYLDIMYPSGSPNETVPVIAHFATLSQRPATFRRDDRPMDPLGWMLDGYALVYVDHIYNPLARHQNYGHFEPGYTLESRNAIAAGSAAIRFLRAHADTYNLGDRIGALGHSKSSYTVMRIADPRHPEQDEHRGYDGFPEGSPEPQPWPGHASRIDAAFASMGSGTRRTEYVSQHIAPLVVACGRHDHFNHWAVFPRLVAACIEADALHLALWMEELGHDRPFGADLATGRERNLLIRHFFAQNLHPHGHEDLEVLFIIPKPDEGDVSLRGATRILTADDELPENMHGISPFSPISVRFARSIDRSTMTPGTLSVRVADTGEPVEGIWSTSLQNSRLSFIPNPPLEPATTYEVRAAPGLRDTEGRTLARPVTQRFRTTETAR